MSFRHTCAAALLWCTLAAPAAAQVEWRITGFENRTFGTTGFGFAGVLEYRNTQSFTSQPIVAIRSIRLQVSENAQAACGPILVSCQGLISPDNAEPGRPAFVGNVDTRTFDTSDGTKWIYDRNRLVGDECRIFACFDYLIQAGSGGVFGCATPTLPPGAVYFYGGRTCAAEGYDGWMRIPFAFVGLLNTVVFNASDLTPSFNLETFSGPNSYVPGTVVPEPSTVALLATGLLGLAGLARRRRA